jgi:ssDNA-binding Zn-finger/Zn-ribbon topoisomerase 1
MKKRDKIVKCPKCEHEMEVMTIIFQESAHVEHYFVCQNPDCQYFHKISFN